MSYPGNPPDASGNWVYSQTKGHWVMNHTTSNPLELIAAERQRQVDAEGWSFAHDDGHDAGEIAMAAACYAAPKPIFILRRGSQQPESAFPWEPNWDKRDKHDRKRQLVIAGALIVAELERLQRVEG